jgi:conflict system pore-forming effector with SLATT domain/uncharacterized protein DUF4231
VVDQLTPVERAWRRQSVWSQTANQLKARLERARAAALGLTIMGAVLALAGTQLKAVNRPVGQVLAFVAAAALALVPVTLKGAGAQQVSDWVQARSVSEALKAEVFLFLAKVARYGDADRDRQLVIETGRLEKEAAPLLRWAAGLQPVVRPLPAVDDLDSYVRERLTQQVEQYYNQQAKTQRQRLQWTRRVEVGLAVLAAILAAAAGVWDVANVGAWVAVVTTVTAAVTAHAAAQRYQFLLIEYLRTAAELERLRDNRGELINTFGKPLTDDEFIQLCEQVISVQNDKWMARWGSDITNAS